MNFIALIFTAFALSMDAFAVSITKGMTIKNLKIVNIKLMEAFNEIFYRYSKHRRNKRS